MSSLRFLLVLMFLQFSAGSLRAAQLDYALAPGDIVRVQVYQNPDLTTEARISESGRITLPLIGGVQISGLSVFAAESKIVKALSDAKLVLKPNVTILLQEARGNQVSVLGQVNKPGRFPLDTKSIRVSDMLALAGGIAATGADSVIVTGERDDKAFRYELDIAQMYATRDMSLDVVVRGGDTLYVMRAPAFYVYGEVQRPGSFRLERNMTLRQAIAASGGTSARGTLKGVQVTRRAASGEVAQIELRLDDVLLPDDVVYVRESLF